MSLVELQKDMKDLLPCNADCGGDHDTYTWGQGDTDVTIRVPIPKGTGAKQVTVQIDTSFLKIGLKSEATPILAGQLFKPIKADDSTWCVEEKEAIVVTLFKANRQYEEWWPHVVVSERQVDMKTLKPPSKHVRDLDGGAQAQVQKMMFDQQQKRQGLPTSEELQMQAMMRQAGMPPQ